MDVLRASEEIATDFVIQSLEASNLHVIFWSSPNQRNDMKPIDPMIQVVLIIRTAVENIPILPQTNY
jgi:hypothetical protein